MKISFIIPVYNAEKFLERCLKSIIAITNVDWECILVNDGSTDNSLNIINEYVNSDPKKFICISKSNGGVSSARNMGIDAATGDRIMFMDADDYFFPKANRLISKVLEKHSDKDQIMFNYAYVNDNGHIKPANYGDIKLLDYNRIIFKYGIMDFTIAHCCGQLFKTEIIKKFNIHFDESMRIGEDLCFTKEYIMNSHNIVMIRNPIYAYYQNQTSAMHKGYESDIYDTFKIIEKNNQLIDKIKASLNKQDFIYYNNDKFREIILIISRILKKSSRKEFVKKSRKYFEIDKIKDIVLKVSFKELSLRHKLSYFFVKNKMFTLFWVLVKLRTIIKVL